MNRGPVATHPLRKTSRVDDKVLREVCAAKKNKSLPQVLDSAASTAGAKANNRRKMRATEVNGDSLLSTGMIAL